MPPCCILCGKPEYRGHPSARGEGWCVCDPKDKKIKDLELQIEGLHATNKSLYNQMEDSQAESDLEISAEMRREPGGYYSWTDRGDGNISDAEFIRYYRRKS